MAICALRPTLARRWRRSISILLAAEQMRAAGGVDDQAVGRVGGDGGRVEPLGPQRQALQRGLVACGVQVVEHQARNQGGGVGDGLAEAQARPGGGQVHMGDRAAAADRPTMTIGASGGGAVLRDALLSACIRANRSVGQRGRKTEMTLCVTGFQLDVEGVAGAAAEKFEKPAGTAHAGNRQRRGGQGRDPPSGGAAVGWPRSAASATRFHRRMAMAIWPLFSAASCRRREAVIDSLATSPTTPARPGQRRPSSIEARTPASSPASAKITRSGGRPTWARDGAKRSRWRRHHRTSPSARARRPGREARRGRAVQGPVGAAGHLVQGAKRQAAARQAGVQRRDAERQHRARRMVLGFEGADLTAKRVERGEGGGDGVPSLMVRRGRAAQPASCGLKSGLHVPSLFSIDRLDRVNAQPTGCGAGARQGQDRAFGAPRL
jgi:hypothetical protein